MKLFRFILFASASSLVLPACGFTALLATLTVEVIDDYGMPVADADAKIGFETSTGRDEIMLGKTDNKGRFTASGHTTGMVLYSARKPGYYDNTDLRFRFPRQEGEKLMPGAPVCQLLLKRVIEPVPMYVRRVALEVPILNAPLGFDLEAGDWVAPHGRGKNMDFIFFVTRRWESMDDFDSSVRLTFTRPLDGIQFFEADQQRGPILASPQHAPETGYTSEWRRDVSASPKAGRKNWNTVEKANFTFRIRTAVDARGTMIQANYGKIYGDIEFGGEASAKMKILFWYYYNPAVNNRSLEFDTTKNLSSDQINKP